MTIETFQLTTLGAAALAVVEKAGRGLTKEQKAFRKFVIGGSDANTILSGDEERILRLWQEKREEVEPEDLSDVLQVQMGHVTEAFNLEWFTKHTGRVVTDHGAEHLSIDYPWMALTCDGLTDNRQTYIDAKHVSAFSKPETIRARYMPQMHHGMIVLGIKHAVLSVIYGNHLWEAYDIPYDPIYGEQLLEAERRFWECVQTGEPPVPMKVESPVEAIRKVDMAGSNEWGDHAATWLANKKAAKDFDKAVKGLKELIDADVVEATGHGVKATRSKAGAVTIREA